MSACCQACEELNVACTSVAIVDREGVEPIRIGRCRKRWAGSDRHVWRGGEIEQVLEAGRRAVQVWEIDADGLVGNRSIGEVNPARDVIEFLPILKVARDPIRAS